MSAQRISAELDELDDHTPVAGSACVDVHPQSGLTRAEGHVWECFELMTSDQWVTGKSHKELALKYSVNVSTVRNWATEASRLIRLLQGNPEDLKSRFSMMLEMWQRRMSEGITPQHATAAVQAIKAHAELMGLITQKHDVSVSMNQYESLSRVDKAAWLRERAQAMLAEAERLEADR